MVGRNYVSRLVRMDQIKDTPNDLFLPDELRFEVLNI